MCVEKQAWPASGLGEMVLARMRLVRFVWVCVVLCCTYVCSSAAFRYFVRTYGGARERVIWSDGDGGV